MMSDKKEVSRKMDARWLRRAEACEYLSISSRCLSDWQQRRLIPFAKVSRKVVLFDRLELDKAMGRLTIRAVGQS